MNLKVIKRECYLATAVRHKENETEKIFRNIYVAYFLCMFKQAMASRSFFIFLLVLLFVLSLSIILFELALTRIFSIVLWYDYAFMAISIAFFGLGIGSFMVHIQRDKLNTLKKKSTIDPQITFSSKIVQYAIAYGISVPVFIFLMATSQAILRISTFFI